MHTQMAKVMQQAQQDIFNMSPTPPAIDNHNDSIDVEKQHDDDTQPPPPPQQQQQPPPQQHDDDKEQQQRIYAQVTLDAQQALVASLNPHLYYAWGNVEFHRLLGQGVACCGCV